MSRGALTRAARLFCVSGQIQNYRFADVTRGYVFQPYPTITTMTSTMMTKTASKKKYPCEKCSSAFSRKGGLTYHQKNECGQEARFKCPYCVYRTGHSSNTRRHVRKCHPGQDVYFIDLGEQKQQQQQRDSLDQKHRSGRSASFLVLKNDELPKNVSKEDPSSTEAQLGRTIEVEVLIPLLLIYSIVRDCEEYRKNIPIDLA